MAENTLSEFDFIDQYLKRLADSPSALGLEDDAAILSDLSGQNLIISKDMLVAGIHFFKDDPPHKIAQKALRVNLSDMAAKGAKPIGYFLGLGLTDTPDRDWISAFCDGLKHDQDLYEISVLGGDTVKSPDRLTLSVTILGTGTPNKTPLRKGAQPGDVIMVSGTLGDSALGLLTSLKDPRLDALDQADRAFLRERYLLPEPRLSYRSILETYAHSSIDVSDGLIADLTHITKASGVGATLNFESIPLSGAAERALFIDPSFSTSILSGGDDYEILFTVAPDSVPKIFEASAQLNLPISQIGVINNETGLQVLKDRKNFDLPSKSGHDHFG